MSLYVDKTGLREERPSTEALVDKHCIVTTPDNVTNIIQARFPQMDGLSVLVNATDVLAFNERRQRNRAEVRKEIIPVIAAVQTQIDRFIGENHGAVLLQSSQSRVDDPFAMNPLSEAENTKFLDADFPTLRHMMIGIRSRLVDLMHEAVKQAIKGYPDREGMHHLGALIKVRPELEKNHCPPLIALKGVLTASFNTPVFFYANGTNAMFERSQMQHGRDLDAADIDTLLSGHHEIVDALTTKSMTHFRAVENSLMERERPPKDLDTSLPISDTDNLWNPDLVWMSGEPTNNAPKRLEFSEELFTRADFDTSYDPVTCSGRGKLMEWFQSLFGVVVDTYMKPNMPKLNALARKSLEERQKKESA